MKRTLERGRKVREIVPREANPRWPRARNTATSVVVRTARTSAARAPRRPGLGGGVYTAAGRPSGGRVLRGGQRGSDPS